MAEIEVQRKEGTNVWMWILGIIILALVIWAAIALLGDEEEAAPLADAPIVGVEPPPAQPIAQTAGVPVSQIIQSPATWTGRTVAGEVRVTEVPSDRGFWIEDQGQRMFVLLQPGGEQAVNINPGQTIRIREAVVRDPTFLTNVQGNIDPETRRILNGLEAYLVTDARNIEMGVGTR